MTRKLITLIAAGGLTLGGLTYLQAQDPHGPKHEHGPGPNHHMENPFDHPKVTAASRDGIELATAVGPDGIGDAAVGNKAFVIPLLVAVVNSRAGKQAAAIMLV